jgi:ABC-2 type transport system ATP-binding protein
VLVSSHLMSEMALTADQLIVIGRGRLIADTSVEEFTRRAGLDRVFVRTGDEGGTGRLSTLLSAPGVSVVSEKGGSLEVAGLSSERIGRIAADHEIALAELRPVQASLEAAFMELTKDAVEYGAPQAAPLGSAA